LPNGTWGSSVSAAPGATVDLMVWDHNNAIDNPSDPNDQSIAHNVKIKVMLPTQTATTQSVSATVGADNAATVTGNVTLNLSTAANVSYIPGSAQLLKNDITINKMVPVNWPTGVNPDQVVTTGVNLGDQHGCWQFAQAVMIQVKVNAPGSPHIFTQKWVQRAASPATWASSTTANPGDLLNFQIQVTNDGTAVGTYTTVTDVLDSRLAFKPFSSTVNAYYVRKVNGSDQTITIDANHMTVQGQTVVFGFDDMQPTADATIFVYFQAQVADAGQFQVGNTNFQNCETSSFTGGISATACANIIITKSPTPVVTFTLQKQVQNMTIGDNSWHDTQAAKPGDEVAFRLVLLNSGNTPAQNVTLKDILPAGLTFDGNVKLYNKTVQGQVISGNDLVNNGYVFATVGNGSDNDQIITFQAKVAGDCSGQNTLTNVAKVIYQNNVAAQSQASVTVVCTRGLVITKTIQDPTDQLFKHSIGFVHEGDVLTYKIVVQNTGNTQLFNIVLKDALPEQVDFVNGSLTADAITQGQTAETGFKDPNTGIQLTNLMPGIPKTIIFQVTVKPCPPLGDIPLVNTATVSANNVPTVSDSASTTVQVRKPVLTF